MPPTTSEGSLFRRVVSPAGESFQFFVGRFHFDFAEFPIVCRVCWVVAERVLVTQLLGDLVERIPPVDDWDDLASFTKLRDINQIA